MRQQAARRAREGFEGDSAPGDKVLPIERHRHQGAAWRVRRHGADGVATAVGDGARGCNLGAVLDLAEAALRTRAVGDACMHALPIGMPMRVPERMHDVHACLQGHAD